MFPALDAMPYDRDQDSPEPGYTRLPIQPTFHSTTSDTGS